MVAAHSHGRKRFYQAKADLRRVLASVFFLHFLAGEDVGGQAH